MESTNAVQMEVQIKTHFERLKANAPLLNKSAAKERIKMLKKLLRVVLSKQDAIADALHLDYGRHPVETGLADTWVVVKEIRFAIRNLENWMKPRYVPTSLVFFGSTSSIHFEAKGVVLILAPWNFPFNLTLSPLVSAIAAGNTVMIKPSEFTKHSSKLIGEIIDESFSKEHVVLCEGNAELSAALLKLPFNHIFFTGSERVGKLVMKAAAENLTSVTLELGGKSPVIVDKTVDLKLAARMAAYAKFCNNGQVCIGADYVYVHEAVAEKFIAFFKEAIAKMYPHKRFRENAAYARIVSPQHFDRIKSLVDDALDKGAELQMEIEVDKEQRFISPVLLTNVTEGMLVNQQEIFGPILPVKTFAHLEELPANIIAHGNPLAMYIFSKDKKAVRYLLQHVSAGACIVNEAFIHHFNSHLPFGGINKSGIGKSHGHFGFLEFSNQKAVIRQWLPWHVSKLLQPPYTKFSNFLTKLLIKYFS